MRQDYLVNEFQQIAGQDRETITIDKFREKYGDRLIESSKKVRDTLTQIENEKKLGLSDGLISFEEFSFLYIFLDF